MDQNEEEILVGKCLVQYMAYVSNVKLSFTKIKACACLGVTLEDYKTVLLTGSQNAGVLRRKAFRNGVSIWKQSNIEWKLR